MARTRSTVRNVMNRAWLIAYNAMNQHNSSVERVTKTGAVASVTEFLSQAMKLAWTEEKTGQTLFQRAAGIPKKVMPRINAALKAAVKALQGVSMTDQERNYQLSVVALQSRYGGDKVTSDMLNQAHQMAYA